jgi:3-dehydroquinate synthase
MMTPSSQPLEAEFHVRYRHRLWFTEDVFGPDNHVLWRALHPEDGTHAKAQVWLDADVAAANPGLASRIEDLFGSCPEQVRLTDDVITIAGGEECKNRRGLVDDVLARFHDAGLDRRSYVVVVGGGAVLDAVGFAAAIAHRGLRLVRLPTTTLAQADSGIGVKNAVNLFDKKNWLGSFAVPWAVVNDVELLRSLPDRDFRAGFAEVVKVALLKCPHLFDTLCDDAAAIRERQMFAAGPAIKASARWHLQHITQGGDPFEAVASRPLDFGHWSAHKLEPMSGFRLRHGEAVAIGVALDVVYSSFMHGFPEADAQRVLACLLDLGLPISDCLLEENIEQVFDGLEEFRQHLGGRLTLTMLTKPGSPIDVHTVDRRQMLTAADYIAEAQRSHLRDLHQQAAISCSSSN